MKVMCAITARFLVVVLVLGFCVAGCGRDVTSNKTEQSQAIEKTHWLNTGSYTRHNKDCRWYKNTKGGRMCGPDEGKACGTCGG